MDALWRWQGWTWSSANEDAEFEDMRLLCELVLELNSQGFGRLRCFPQLHPHGMSSI